MHYPSRDTDQPDPTGGFTICRENGFAIQSAKSVHIYWAGVEKSSGSRFDLGMTFSQYMQRNMDIVLINYDDVEQAVFRQIRQGIPKSWEQLLIYIAKPGNLWYEDCMGSVQNGEKQV